MPDEITQRLQDSVEKCITSYEEWRTDKKNSQAHEALRDAVHELRKVASRLEIELVSSERDNTPQKLMQAPAHRNANKGRGPKKQENNGGNKNTDKEKALEKLKKKPAPKKEDSDKQ